MRLFYYVPKALLTEQATLCHPQPAGLSLRSGDQGFPLTHSTISMTPGFYFHSRKH